MKILVFDNYDSFTYNLVHLVQKITHDQVDVYRNDELPMEKVKGYDKIILSPGPGIPSEAGMLLPLIKEYAASKSILGVCLGHQAIGEAFGATLTNLSTVYHGVATKIHVVSPALADSPGIFKDLPATIEVARYHSWVVDEKGFPEELEITAKDDNNYIMALQHRKYDVEGVQFHPESVLTPDGETMMRNWLKK
ncbi:MAG: aminodeoxychorismate/anthranilate synthase component II [Chitinophagaceae bacterium]|nr:aminodeoxychorismate/anthranilate synthase component II [Chitinophagaceae bacterium]MEA3426058.1 aminodeoxychorismate/anthranilate synthase component II [Bacteroidota bacterium]MCA6453262.1 aminodeoxychorismate/anthranilate synthase component II [Chitinophagaceae bacterium]MCA6454497.1 aminodeoxychorismate/anthranilate synthase component II [Chitinophagaceae bacterium]MCA6459236.1 aminodeoxychorismate/anthranilate synthase component II [Chitinophagaceae bacterium]